MNTNKKCDVEVRRLTHTITINTWILKSNSGIWYRRCTPTSTAQTPFVRKRTEPCTSSWLDFLSSQRRSDGQNLLHSGNEKKHKVEMSTGSSVTASLVGSLAGCLIRVATDVKWQALPEQVKQLHLNYKLFIHVTHKTHCLYYLDQMTVVQFSQCTLAEY
jgi:type III secretory pathway component EscS